jgi:aminocarboxymuconate-semialdehyde decarboxylase
LEIGKFIEEMDLDPSVKEDIFCHSTLEWLDIDPSRFE